MFDRDSEEECVDTTWQPLVVSVAWRGIVTVLSCIAGVTVRRSRALFVRKLADKSVGDIVSDRDFWSERDSDSEKLTDSLAAVVVGLTERLFLLTEAVS